MTKHTFSEQEKPGLDLTMDMLNEHFGGISLEVHEIIMDIMKSEDVPITDKLARRMLATMAIRVTNLASNIEF